MTSASGIGQAKSCPTKSEVPQCRLLLVEGLRPCTLASGCYCKDEMRLRPETHPEKVKMNCTSKVYVKLRVLAGCIEFAPIAIHLKC